MSREEVFRATGPTAGGVIEVKLGAKKDGTIVAAEARRSSTRPAPSRARRSGRAACAASRCTTSRTSRSSATTSCRNRPKVAAYRAPGAPNSTRSAVESCIDELARELEHRSARAARDQRARRTAPRRRTGRPGPISAITQTLEAAKAHAHLKTPLGPNQGRGIASGFWFNIGGESSRGGATSTRTARSASSRATPISAARAPRWR